MRNLLLTRQVSFLLFFVLTVSESALVPHYRLVLGFEASYPVPPPANTMYSKLVSSRLLTRPDYNRPIYFMEFDLSDTSKDIIV